MKDQDDWKGRIESVLGSDTEMHPRNFIKWREHLLKELALPLLVTGIEDFPWEEPYVIGGWSNKEYEELKKNNPSYTDEFELNEIKLISDDDDLIAVVTRVSDNKVFEIGLSWLEVCEGGTEENSLLNDYSVWRFNY